MSGRYVRHRRDDGLSRVSWQEFERLLAVYYRGQGYEVEHCGTGVVASRFDGGIDLKLRRGVEYVLVQCKHWNAWQVAHNDVHQLLGLMVNEGATGAILVTSGEFTRAAVDAANRHGHVQLVDGDAVRQMVGVLPRDAAEDGVFVSGTSRVGSDVAGRLLDVVEHRVRHGQWTSRRRRSPYEPLLRLAVGLVGLLIVGALLKQYLADFTTSAQSSRSGNVSAPVSTGRVAAPAPNQPAMTTPRAISNAQERTPRFETGPQMTEEELREWERHNAESMKILEATTPEM